MRLKPESLLSCESGQEALKQVLLELPESQAGPERHRCCHCAFQYGLQDARQGWQPTTASDIRRCTHGKVARLSSVKKIHENQGGLQRHKCAVCAYAKGFHFDEESLFAYEEAKSGNGGLIIVEPPDISTGKKGVIDKETTHRNYWVNLKSDRAKEIGLAGEEMIMELEKKKLCEANRPALAKKIIHVSKDWGDGAGYDILSYDVDGTEILIEVKTTTLKDKNTSFIITANELACARQNREKYRICRIFEFNPDSDSGNVFYLSVEQLEKMRLTPLQYKCEFQYVGDLQCFVVS